MLASLNFAIFSGFGGDFISGAISQSVYRNSILALVR